MHTALRYAVSAAAAAGVVLAAGAANADKKYGPGVSDTEIKIGNTNPYSGPASSYGTIGKVIKAYFDKVNAEGGVNGRKIKFITLDDGYSPPKTKEQFRKLVEREKVLFIFQSLGTPTNSAVHKYMNKKKVPQLFVATGATKWGQPKKFPWTMGWQPNYQTEGAVTANYLKINKPDAKVAILFQNDDYGKDYVKGFKDALGPSLAAKMIVAEESYEVTDPTVDSQVINLKASGADTFFNVAIPKFAAQAIRKIYDIGWRPVQLLNSVSSSVSSVLKPAGLEKSKGNITTAYLMDPTDPSWTNDPEYLAWLKFMDKYYPSGDKTNSFNAYGYSVGHTLVQVLKQCGDNLTRENIMKEAASLRKYRSPMLLPGITVSTSPNDFYPIESMQMQKFDGEKWLRFGKVVAAESS
ncbi:MAG TPA: ABC transporter substrate-binding protein [Alphaproteobacteria bacterium]|nr:ABC transporter substrate-binding protein [Alphaproteobacteria bacterium]MDP6269973.1 ABC transporter substrate-binding protein [Alphaproteobacteria bacterium]MDP7164634.1 ABC transporter substrate-binding protein [Alphaproteobacteria bacterium]MDP7428639.1 ABC transporter substrate-binding protein [Alphaproteobacteria bacterium]HJM49669.1 ABC transporter substrate-binding protein [Alphaproteobacteria bacterium]